MSRIFSIALLLFLSCPGGEGVIAQQEGRKDDAARKDGGRLPEGREAELSEEEMKRLREALRNVWTDPTVLSARENVNRSALEFQKAVRDSIARNDPEAAALLSKVQKSSSGLLHKVMGGERGKRPPFGSGRSFDHMIGPAMLDRMNPDQRNRYLEVSEEAKKHPAVVAAVRELRAISSRDDEIRRQKMEAIRKIRRSYFDAIVTLAPELREALPEPGSYPPGGFRGKGGKRPPGKGERPRPEPEISPGRPESEKP